MGIKNTFATSRKDLFEIKEDIKKNGLNALLFTYRHQMAKLVIEGLHV
jgi:hypothetical protein